MKTEVANELGLHQSNNIKDNYIGNITTKEAGKIAGFKNVGNVGGEMVRCTIEQSEKELSRRE